VVGKPGADKEGTDNNETKGKNKFTGKCFYCKKPGHKQADCTTKKRDEKSETATVAANVSRDRVVLMANDAKADGYN